MSRQRALGFLAVTGLLACEPSGSQASLAQASATAAPTTTASAAAPLPASPPPPTAAPEPTAPRDPSLAPEAEVVEPEQTEGNLEASKRGNSCYLLYRRHRYSEARAKCLEALTFPGKSRFTHGALFFNLGLIAEATGNRAAAATYYRKSLKVRPEGVPAEKVWGALRKLER